MAYGRTSGRERFCGGPGFSVAEMLVAVCALTTLLAVSVPFVPGILQSYQLLGASREIYGELQKARLSAVAANHRFVFTVLDSRRYKVHADKNNNGVEDTGEEIATRDLRLESPSITIAAANPIVFAATGRARTAGTVTVTNPGGQSKSVVVSAGGRVRIQ